MLALRAPAEETQIPSAIDARMGELYVARFERVDGLPVARDAERVCAPAAVALPEELSAYGVGTGFAAAEGALVAQLGTGLRGFDATALPRASDVLALAVPAFARGETVAPEKVEPAYLRDNVALTLVEQQAAREARRGQRLSPRGGVGRVDQKPWFGRAGGLRRGRCKYVHSSVAACSCAVLRTRQDQGLGVLPAEACLGPMRLTPCAAHPPGL